MSTTNQPIDTFNKFGVGGMAGSDDLVILAFNRRLSRDDALLLAAYLVAIADMAGGRFELVLAAVLNT